MNGRHKVVPKQEPRPVQNSALNIRAKIEMFSYLRFHGLYDCDYWLTQLKELGVQSKASLVKLQGDKGTFSKLRPKARNPAEEKCLTFLLDIPPAPQMRQSNPVDKTVEANSLQNVLNTVAEQKNKFSESLDTSFILNNEDALTLLEKLELSKYYPKGLGLRDAQCIRLEPLKLSLGIAHTTHPRQLPFLVLQKLMSCDSRCRSDLMPSVVKKDDYQSDHSESGSSNDSLDSHNLYSDSLSSGIHPVDCLLSLIICSDDLLQQDLFSRLAKCQLAVPFILQDPFTKKLTLPLWALRSIIKEWECTEANGEVQKKVQPIVSYSMPIVTFIRLGKHQGHTRSKSAILNAVISDSHYNHFFHCDSQGGEYKAIINEGLVDMCWYLPGKSTNAFPDAITFLNLHGDAKEHPRQLSFLSQISSMCFVLLTEEDLELDDNTVENMKQLSLSVGGITVLGSIRTVPTCLKKKRLIDLRKKNVVGIRDQIRYRIKQKLDFCSLFKLKSIDSFGIEEGLTDCSEAYKQGLAHANKVKMLITSFQTLGPTNKVEPGFISSMKDTFLPLQGEGLLKAWAEKVKEHMRQINRGNKSVNEYTEHIKREKIAIRKKQLQHVETPTPVMGSFIASLLTLGEPSNRVLRKHFLQCLKLELNNLSRESISELQCQYQSTQKELKESSNAAKVQMLKKRLKDLQQYIISSSFGLEHLLRELGQVYEAALESGLYGDSLCRLPQAAAELLIDGYPLELMDGETAHVPIQWITAVLGEATKMLGDPNIFVLSVLGLQSTGKSTLLNTVFGLQFNVSAGRCTRGAFMQLLPLDQELRTQSKCDYVLVVDTEGLHAPQLDHLEAQKYDSELFTFVIGLANVTLINIYGDVSGEMDDILQASIHAFLRINPRVVNFNPSCQFVHHNAATTSLNGDIGCANLTKKLDNYTIEAAKAENCEGKFKSFNDVIKFNDQTDVHYFPRLWEGSPPMARVNPDYSHAAQTLKHHLIEMLVSPKTNSFLGERATTSSLHTFQIKVKDLWNALLKENFVFSFKNNQEIIAYNALETEYSKWEWELRVSMLDWEQKAENEINGSEAEFAPQLAVQKCKELQQPISKLSEPIDENIFFRGKYKELVVQWKLKFELRLQSLLFELREHAQSHCTKLGRKREALSKFEHIKKSYPTMITLEVQDYIAKLKREQRGKEGLDEEELQTIFNGIWTKIIKQLPPVFVETVDVENEVEKKLITFAETNKGYSTQLAAKLRQKSTLREWGTRLEIEPSETYYNILSKPSLRKLGDVVSYYATRGGRIMHITDPHKVEVTERTKKVFNKAKECLEHITKQKTDFNPGFTQELLREVDAAITAVEDHHLTFTPEYRFTMYLIVCGYALPTFEEMARRFRNKNDPLILLEKREKRPLFFQFKHLYFQTKAEEAIAKTLCVRLEDPVKDRIKQKIGSIMVGKMRASQSHFNSPMDLKVKVLTDLHAEDSYNHIMEYVIDVKQCLQKRIRNYTVQYCDESTSKAGETRLQAVTKKEVNGLITLVGSVVTEVIVASEMGTSEKEVKIPRASFQERLSTLSKTLIKELGCINVDALLVGYDSLNEISLSNFRKQIQNELKELEKRLYGYYATVKCEKDMTNWKDTPFDLLSDLVGCTEQCPFCGEQCDLRDPDHYKNNNVKHRTGIHRPSCLANFKDRRTKVMATQFCPFLVASDRSFQNSKTNGKFHPYKKYEDIYPEWSIPPDPSAESCLYWKWFVAKYSEELAETYDAKPADVPKSWCDIEWPEVVKNLTVACKIETSRNYYK